MSAGLRALPNKSTSFASTQVAWRFYKNDSITLTKLHGPLLIATREGIATHCGQHALCGHDFMTPYPFRQNNKTGHCIALQNDAARETKDRIAVDLFAACCKNGSHVGWEPYRTS